MVSNMVNYCINEVRLHELWAGFTLLNTLSEYIRTWNFSTGCCRVCGWWCKAWFVIRQICKWILSPKSRKILCHQSQPETCEYGKNNWYVACIEATPVITWIDILLLRFGFRVRADLRLIWLVLAGSRIGTVDRIFYWFGRFLNRPVRAISRWFIQFYERPLFLIQADSIAYSLA